MKGSPLGSLANGLPVHSNDGLFTDILSRWKALIRYKGVNILDKIKFTIDQHEVYAKPGQTILDAALDAGIYIPHICSHDNLHPSGSCRLCAVEIEGRDGVLLPVPQKQRRA